MKSRKLKSQNASNIATRVACKSVEYMGGSAAEITVIELLQFRKLTFSLPISEDVWRFPDFPSDSSLSPLSSEAAERAGKSKRPRDPHGKGQHGQIVAGWI